MRSRSQCADPYIGDGGVCASITSIWHSKTYAILSRIWRRCIRNSGDREGSIQGLNGATSPGQYYNRERIN